MIAHHPNARSNETKQKLAALTVPTDSCQPFSVQFLQHGGNVDQAELAAKVANDGGVVQHQQLPDTLTVATLTQVHRLQQVAEIQVPEGDAALPPRHQQRL